jgi:hypothetical protein
MPPQQALPAEVMALPLSGQVDGRSEKNGRFDKTILIYLLRSVSISLINNGVSYEKNVIGTFGMYVIRIRPK